MKRTILLTIITVFFGGFLSLSLRSQQKVSLQWGPEEGNFEVPTGTTFCGYKGMRLPTKDELLETCKAGVTKDWDKEGKYYLTNTPASAPNHFFTVHSGNCSIQDIDGDESTPVRCVRVLRR